ncbi:hypothetical protein PMI21_01105 [Pseudomonas sp. GM18]|uniref:hypothetical protein n=1 Tax=Pseudomonas sp. GM18 TaxID=1144324 RepID=UPI00027265CC|nr:hypothetical protein [Pseudomonas sp. GM18]EJM20202.1 hypothetical protein PMI21_01105 [Pseudomonas sp. GM18]
MQSLMQQRVDGLQALRLRAIIATSEFYSLIGKEEPVQKVRFQVKTVGSKAYHIVDLVTGKTRGFRFEYASAVDYAKQLEDKANRLPGGAQ